MKTKFLSFFALIIIASIALLGCSKTVNTDQLLYRNGLVYEVNKTTPFTGKEIAIIDGIKYRETHYVSGIIDGQEKIWYENAQLKEVSNYNSGILVSFEHWFSNGQASSSIQFDSMSRWIGENKHWYSNGQLLGHFQYDSEGVPIGVQKKWYENGKLKYFVDYGKGNEFVKGITYDSNGNKKDSIFRSFNDMGRFFRFILENYGQSFNKILTVLKGADEVKMVDAVINDLSVNSNNIFYFNNNTGDVFLNKPVLNVYQLNNTPKFKLLLDLNMGEVEYLSPGKLESLFVSEGFSKEGVGDFVHKEKKIKLSITQDKDYHIFMSW